MFYSLLIKILDSTSLFELQFVYDHLNILLTSNIYTQTVYKRKWKCHKISYFKRNFIESSIIILIWNHQLRSFSSIDFFFCEKFFLFLFLKKVTRCSVWGFLQISRQKTWSVWGESPSTSLLMMRVFPSWIWTVVYFDQRTGVLHDFCWSKSSFLHFFSCFSIKLISPSFTPMVEENTSLTTHISWTLKHCNHHKMNFKIFFTIAQKITNWHARATLPEPTLVFFILEETYLVVELAGQIYHWIL